MADKVENGLLTEDVTVGDANGEIYAEVPDGVKLADGADSLELIVQAMQNSQADIQLEVGESKQAFNIHMDGVAADNTVPMLITIEKMFKPDLNSTSVAMYHVENGQTVAMTSVALADLDAHNEFYYNVSNGNVILCVASFSEYVAVTDNKNPWEGTLKTDWYNTTDTVFTLNTAEEFAGFGLLVDGGNTFDGKTIKLGADINLEGFDAEGNRYSFNPIGCGYEDSTINSNGVEGRVFKGIFDGQGHTITGLYQNGWEIGLSYCNLGGGLFASVKDATIQNLTISGAEIVMECVEQGVVAGLVQGSCTFANINIYGCSVANYQKATGGLIGEVSGTGTTTITNVNIDSTTVVGSLWGDFDAPVGGVIGARWDNENANPQILMTNVTVAARLDVYNDVTSAYQWYAYRRAGMLIGNTETSATTDGRTVATAAFLKCENVKVYYGDWVNYHYCEFTNQDDAWQNGYPWVRVEAGENCAAFSNPRYGNPIVNGVKITTLELAESNKTNDAYIPFAQLYGGGQGVYGEDEHKNVNTYNYAYTIQYINDNKVLAETYVLDNSDVFTLSSDDKTNYDAAVSAAEKWVKAQGFNVEFGGWVNAGSTKVTEIKARNTESIKLFPYFNSPYTARFVDDNGNVLAWCLFHREKLGNLNSTKEQAENALHIPDGFTFEKWEVHITNDEGETITREDYNQSKFADYTSDVTIYPVYQYEGDVRLIPVDDDGNGTINYYQVGGYGAKTGEQELVEIPGYVNGIPVTTINADAFSSYDDLHSVRIPGTISSINSQAFSADDPNKLGSQRDTVTLYYEGDPAVWNAAMEAYNNRRSNNYDADGTAMLKENWDNMMGNGSRVFFLDENGKVINTCYWELNDDWVWVLHKHAYSYAAAKTCSHGEKSHYEYERGFIGIGAGLQENKFTNYAGECKCDLGTHIRSDEKYWTPVTTTGDEE